MSAFEISTTAQKTLNSTAFMEKSTMKIYLALTDEKRFGFHRDRNHREVNFWKAPNVILKEECDLVVFKRHDIISRHDNEIPADGKKLLVEVF